MSGRLPSLPLSTFLTQYGIVPRDEQSPRFQRALYVIWEVIRRTLFTFHEICHSIRAEGTRQKNVKRQRDTDFFDVHLIGLLVADILGVLSRYERFDPISNLPD